MKKFLLVFFLLIISYFFLYKIYIPRVSAFGCFDDCHTIAAGYFINQHKILYSEIFYNHQMIPAYISAVIQNVMHPINIFDLVLRHRQFVILVGFLFNLFLILRFGRPAIFFFLFFEMTKFYIFGDRFLGEGMLVYPLVYLFFIFWRKINKLKISNYDFALAAFFSWLVIFLRETFTPLGILLFIFILFPYSKWPRIKTLSVSIFFILTAVSLLNVNFKDYYFSLIEINKSFFTVNFGQILIYPILILTSDKSNIFKTVLFVIDVLFLFSIIYLVVLKKKLKYLFIFIPLMLANLRVVYPGKIFYDAFHMIPFYGVFLVSTFLLIDELKIFNKKFWIASTVISIILFLYYVTSSQTFFRDKINRHAEFFTNYGNILQVGEIVKKISNSKDTFFADGFDEVVYWVANRPSPYKYSMNSSLASNFPIYRDAKIEMFEKNPPDFYYGSCPNEESTYKIMPSKFIGSYVRLVSFGKPSCVFVKKTKLKDITEAQWKGAKEFGYELPLE